MKLRFANRSEAGRALARELEHFAHRSDVVVLALPRGGVPVGFEVARALHAPLRPFIVRKLGVPGHSEFAMGAVASGGACYLDESTIRQLRLPPASIQNVLDREKRELARREQEYHAGELQLQGRTVIIVDDGLATGSTMHAAVLALQQQGPRSIVIAVPVAPPDARERFAHQVDELVLVHCPFGFQSVGEWYEEFDQTSDDEVRQLLAEARTLEQSDLKPIAF